jgi:hypothetical protein
MHGKVETILAVVPGDSPDERLVLALEDQYAHKPLVLRSESFSPDVGWFTQSTVRLTRRELTGLKNVLGISVARGCHQTANRVHENQSADEPLVLSFATAKRA